MDAQKEQSREIPLHESANRPNQLLGGDRELVISSGMVSAIMPFALGNIWGIAAGLCFWLASVWTIHRMGKADPLLRSVYVRHIRYRGFYPAKSGLHSAALEPRGEFWK
jgi:type IV secretory pathway TrbD component